jgi:hypothetical protein
MIYRSFLLLFFAAGTLSRNQFGGHSNHPTRGRHRQLLNRLPRQDIEDIDDPENLPRGDNNTTNGASTTDTPANSTSTPLGASGPYKLDVSYTGQDFFK